LEEFREALRLDPNNAVNYENLGIACAVLNRLDEAEAVYKQAEERKLESEVVLQNRYFLAFLKGDRAQMAQLAEMWISWFSQRAEQFQSLSRDIPGAFARYAAAGHIQVLTKPNGGKAAALNFALDQLTEEFYVGRFLFKFD